MDKPTRTIANQIVDGGDSPDKQGSPINYVDLVKAVQRGDWNATRDFLESHPNALRARITVTGGTVLHVAVAAKREHIVEELLKLISEEDSAIEDYAGNTALHETTTIGNTKMAVSLIRKNKNLVRFRSNALNELPVVSATAMGHTRLARYLYFFTPLEELEAEQAEQGAKLLTYAIYARDLVIALRLMRHCPSSALALDRGYLSPWQALAVGMTTSAISSRNWLSRRIYINHWQAALLGQRVSSLLNFLAKSALFRNCQGLKLLSEATLVDLRFYELLSRMCKGITTSYTRHDCIIAPAIFDAISRGNFIFVFEILKANSELLFIRNSCGMTIFHYAVQHRQNRIFSLIYGLTEKNALLRHRDHEGNTILHIAGKLTEVTPIDHITGSVLQMQREVQWFKEVERICPPISKELLNRDGLSARDLFTKTHRKLREKGEKWMKATTTSGSVVGTLIVTIMFAAAFTIPGGNNQETGSPILANDKLFKIFIIADSLSLFSSSTAVLMFLGIFTSRYADEDFLKSLPRKMIIGFSTLFFSIITMMIAFSAALLLTLRGESWIVVAIIGLAGVPILFVLMPFRLLVDMFRSTYGGDMFDRKMKPWF